MSTAFNNDCNRETPLGQKGEFILSCMNNHKTRILFVDDEPQVLKILQLSLRSFSAEWDMYFAPSGKDGLALLHQQPCDIVISDMRMPGMTGAEFLNEVMRLYPNTVRVILSGYSDQELVMQCIGCTHQYLSKPVDLVTFRSTLNRIRSLHLRLMKSEIRRLVSGVNRLPSIPKVYFEIMEAMQKPDTSIERISEIVSSDPALSAKILQLANSAFFGAGIRETNTTEAVQFLGINIINAIALTSSLFDCLDAEKYREFDVDRMWRHSMDTGALARKIARIEGCTIAQQDTALTGGLLHDIGKLLLINNFTINYRKLFQKNSPIAHQPLHVREQLELLANHADVGGYLIGIWGLPQPLVETVFYHHEPSKSKDHSFSPLTAVHVANCLLEISKDEPKKTPNFDMEYLTRLGLEERIGEWQSLLDDTEI